LIFLITSLFFLFSTDFIYYFGGFRCTAFGVLNQGGPACFSPGVYVFEVYTMTWHLIEPPTPNSPFALYAEYWPSYRAYGVADIMSDQRYAVFSGGVSNTSFNLSNYFLSF
jgi:hypothetical protein